MHVLSVAAAASGQTSPEAAEVIDRVIDAYTVSVPYTQTVRVVRLDGLDREMDLRMVEPSMIAGLSGGAESRVEVLFHPERGVLVDGTNPTIRSVRGRVQFTLYGASGEVHRVTPASARAQRHTMSRDAVQSAPSEYVPSALAWSLRRRAAQEPAVLEHDTEGNIVLRFPAGKREYHIDPGDYTILWMRNDADPDAPLMDVFLDLRRTPLMKARAATYRLRRVAWKPGTGHDLFQIATIFDPPKVGAVLREAEFRWQSHADEAVRVSDGAIFDHEERQIGIDESVLKPRRRVRNAVELDQKSVARHAADPTEPVRVRRPAGAGTYLMAFGITCLLLAGAWAIRRRIQ